MTDPLNIALSLGASAVDDTSREAAKLATSLWMKVLGPPADALGGHLKARMQTWSEDALAHRVLSMAAKKTNMDIPGSVPPRVAAQVLDQARWSDDEFIAEYLSGVLASSRTADSSDDSGVAWAALVGRLPALALRLHFVLYRSACDVLQGTRMKSLESLRGTRIVIGYHELWETLERTTLWDQTRVLEAFSLLQREKLVEERSRYGSLSYVGEVYPKSTQELARRQASARVTGALVFEPTWHGAQFFMWGVGEGARGPLHWINDAAARDFSSSLPAAKGAFLSLDDVPDIIVDGGKP